MRFDPPLESAILLKRYKRFLADIRLPDGTETTIHCPNTGSMKNCQPELARVWFSDSKNPKRKLPCTWELVEIPVRYGEKTAKTLACVNTGRANAVVQEAIENKVIPELSEYDTVRREVKYGEENSRIDLLLTRDGLPDCYIEVKSVTLATDNGFGEFPDAVTTRGQKHLRELEQMVAQGHRAVLLFCVQHTGIEVVSPADDIDPAYGKALRHAINNGVEVMVWGCTITPEDITLNRQLQLRLP
ncbi:DNA/RNA nuclease SfsA [Parendozoicomonas haliclonae]|uniref:Sugar fermentation stimulation protein homolog n=1 Tax=Parendozoicomonas haliclonae TaxID=1960125 RepID=A0A1X7AIZ5_9GAMM|nr:DNA/RNA nuclease SfsA [Parendozoicomonas haliclonae]SMA44952.1 Sugar fermentation stimulation protein A [Parendozoicomonas haliclonae]